MPIDKDRISTETFSSVDAAWLHMDSPSNLAVITGIITVDGRLEYERLKNVFEKRLLVYRRFLQRVAEPALPLGLPRWEADPEFDLEAHIIRLELPEPADQAELQKLVSRLMSEPLDPKHPLWVFYLVENYAAGGALVCRLHHCIADGLALMQVLLSTADSEADGDLLAVPEPRRREPGLLTRLLIPAVKAVITAGDTWKAAGSFVHEGMDTLVNPSRLFDLAKAGASSTKALGKLLLIGPDRKTLLRGGCGVPKRAAWSQFIPLDTIKNIGRLMNGTVNDVLLSAVTGALRRYLDAHGENTEGLNIRTIVPVNLRNPGDVDLMGNRFGLVFLSLPVGIQDPLRRLVVLKRRMDAIKDSPEAVVALGILSAIGMSPTQVENLIVAIFGMKGTAVMTNVPGPRQPLYLAGQCINTLMFWVPTPASLGVGVSIISYADQVMLGVATDEGLVPDPETVVAYFHEELDYLARWGRPPAPSQAAGAAGAELQNKAQD